MYLLLPSFFVGVVDGCTGLIPFFFLFLCVCFQGKRPEKHRFPGSAQDVFPSLVQPGGIPCQPCILGLVEESASVYGGLVTLLKEELVPTFRPFYQSLLAEVKAPQQQFSMACSGSFLPY